MTSHVLTTAVLDARSARSIAIVLATLAACRSAPSRTSPRSADSTGIVVARMLPVRAWELRDGERLLGVLVRFEDPDDASKAFFSARNPDGQEIGIVDVDGRAWRHRPHQREPEWIGTGTVQDGARRILDGHAGMRMIETGIERLRGG